MHSFEVHSNESACRKSGRLGLEQVSFLFIGQVKRILKYDGITKAQWIISVWNSRNRVRITAGLGSWDHNQMAGTFIQRHKKRREKNGGLKLSDTCDISTRYNRRRV